MGTVMDVPESGWEERPVGADERTVVISTDIDI